MSETVTYEIKELNVDMIPPITERMNDPDYGGSKLVVIGKPGCFTAGTKIMMYDGEFKNVEDVKDEEMEQDKQVQSSKKPRVKHHRLKSESKP